MDRLLAELRLAGTQGIGPRLRQNLLLRFGSAAAVFAAEPSDLRAVDGVGPKLVRNLTREDSLRTAAEELARCREVGVTLLIEGEEDYPTRLAEIPDPPGVLFLRGELLPQDALAVAIVGTRNPTPYGERQAERLAYHLARQGVTIVSGLAYGVDVAAHRGALAAGGRTLAVLGSGLSRIYPPEHEPLARDLVGQGALLSECWCEAAPRAHAFPQRNRIISGLSLGVLVVEAPKSSGALGTAAMAMEQGRELFAVPGRVDSPNSAGCHRLIRDGATLVESAEDILESLGPLPVPATDEQGAEVHHPAELQLTDQERHVLAAVGREATDIDTIADTAGLPMPRVLSTLLILETRRLVERHVGNRYSRGHGGR